MESPGHLRAAGERLRRALRLWAARHIRRWLRVRDERGGQRQAALLRVHRQACRNGERPLADPAAVPAGDCGRRRRRRRGARGGTGRGRPLGARHHRCHRSTDGARPARRARRARGVDARRERNVVPPRARRADASRVDDRHYGRLQQPLRGCGRRHADDRHTADLASSRAGDPCGSFEKRGILDVVSPGPNLSERLTSAVRLRLHSPGERRAAIDLGGLDRLVMGLLGSRRVDLPEPAREELAA